MLKFYVKENIWQSTDFFELLDLGLFKHGEHIGAGSVGSLLCLLGWLQSLDNHTLIRFNNNGTIITWLSAPASTHYRFYCDTCSYDSEPVMSKLTECGGGINCTTGKVYTGARISLGGITNTVSLLWKYLLKPPILWECRLSLGRVWSAARTLTVPGSHGGLFYRAWLGDDRLVHWALFDQKSLGG